MNKKQRKLIEIWVIFSSVLIITVIFQSNDAVARLVLIALAIYVLLNYKVIKSFESAAPTVTEVIRNNNVMSTFTFIYVALVIIVTFYFLLKGKDISIYISGWGSFMLIFAIPLILPFITVQYIIFKALGDENL